MTVTSVLPPGPSASLPSSPADQKSVLAVMEAMAAVDLPLPE
uniref:Uncharacterized protein n=1 Tax=Peronospora matthiolae TaxID=2874970 RepID=A0AAV1TN32_9STRA